MDNNFKDIKGFNGKYKINKDGVIINVKTNYQLKPYKNKQNHTLRIILRDDNKNQKTRSIYDLVNNTFNLNLNNNDIQNYYNHHTINNSKNRITINNKHIKLILKNGIVKKFNSLTDASKFLNKNEHYLSVYLKKYNQDHFVIINNKFICYIEFQ